ncbi:pentatricopeptide repeat-containing protein At5g19020, mitochondrial-like [Nicotiana tabacum]|uniref:Pentatricopeptide repeat-containing protein At5g19020, mitochondrial-like n=1 Tax=Nicotiana tabacum TaxID=4097 RepID=A0A1S4AKA7_TOBAC|nr:PREDICTED: pentatricopeptide repeat-containing protein At5g19020, mitochondrial-like [Nicotiana tabacum]
MIIGFRHKPSFHLLVPIFSLSFPSPKWVSSSAQKTPSSQTPLNHQPHLQITKKQKPNYEFSLVSAFKSCSTDSCITQGQQLHSLVLKSGLESNIYILNSLITFYVKCGLVADAKTIFDTCTRLDVVSCNIMLCGYVKFGLLVEARVVFDKMPERNCVSYTTMIMGLVQKGYWSEAIWGFRDMRYFGVGPNEVTMVNVISAYLHYGGVEAGKMLHGLVLKVGVMDFVHVSTNLLHLYCLSGCLKDASMLFNEMPQKNVVSWNVMLNGYTKAGLVDLSREVFEQIADKDVVSWGTIIDGYLQVGRLSEAVRMYSEMLYTGLRPNDVMIVDFLSTCGQVMSIYEGRQFHGVAVKKGFDILDFIQATIVHFYAACGEVDLARLQFEVGNKNHVACWNALIAGLIRNRKIDEARHLFDQMPARDVFSWSSMISGYSQSEQPDLALELFHEMLANGVKPNEITMVSVLSSIATLGSFKEGRWAHDYICKNSIPLNDNLSAALIDMYAKCANVNDALAVFNQVREKAVDVSPWNAIICGLAMHGHVHLSLDIFSDLRRRTIKPNSITFIGVLSACCHAGLVEAGEQHFQSMTKLYNVKPNVKHYGCMVDLFGRAGRLKEAEELIRSMPMEADTIIWGTLLAACRTHGNTEIGERAAENLARVEPSHGPSRVLLSNIYADAGKWDDAFLVRQAMRSRGLTRSTAYSGVVR